ncbi:MAG: VOC family protein [Bifidobacteriaceae bacterium]|jgi:catechol 2,3-dioxygenase-like lactoylglutathione lyase family enzyme|nr:VOC family protein [Bifidobacteriaceae bacterium]
MTLHHISLQCTDVTEAAAFYDAALAPLGVSRQLDFAPHAIGYGSVPGQPDFWIGGFDSGDGFRETHVAFAAKSRDEVDAFFTAAKTLGAEVLHEPRLWPEYTPSYYGAFVRDPDGNNIEAVTFAEPA